MIKLHSQRVNSALQIYQIRKLGKRRLVKCQIVVRQVQPIEFLQRAEGVQIEVDQTIFVQEQKNQRIQTCEERPWEFSDAVFHHVSVRKNQLLTDERVKLLRSSHNFRKRVIFSRNCAGMNDMLLNASILRETKH